MCCARVSARARATPYTCRRAGGSVHLHFALVTVSESSKVPKSRLYVQTRGSRTLELWDDHHAARAFVPSSPSPPYTCRRAGEGRRDEGGTRRETSTWR
jgi:hypothetical protein